MEGSKTRKLKRREKGTQKKREKIKERKRGRKRRKKERKEGNRERKKKKREESGYDLRAHTCGLLQYSKRFDLFHYIILSSRGSNSTTRKLFIQLIPSLYFLSRASLSDGLCLKKVIF